jgi:hypothetical protein
MLHSSSNMPAVCAGVDVSHKWTDICVMMARGISLVRMSFRLTPDVHSRGARMGRVEPHTRRACRGHHSEAFIGIDTAKLRNAVAGRRGRPQGRGATSTCLVNHPS